MEKIQSCISYKDGYRYVWDEERKFIIYQKDNRIILGTSNHSGPISKLDIKELYEISIRSLDINRKGINRVVLEHRINLENFLYLASYKDVTKIINKLRGYFFLNILDEKDVKKLSWRTRTISFNIPKSIIPDDCMETISPNFWKLTEKNTSNSVETMTLNIIRDILNWFYEIGIRKSIDNNGYDFMNTTLINKIVYLFNQNKFQVLEEEATNSLNIIDEAIKANEEYNKCIEILEYFVNKLAEKKVTDEDKKIASDAILNYHRIVGEYYPFIKKISEKLSESSNQDSILKRTVN